MKFKMKLFDFVEINYHFLNDGETVFIDLFYIPPQYQKQGFGSKAFERFLSTMHSEVTEIRLVSANNMTDCVNIFWEKLGFKYLYDIKDECFDAEILNTMTRPLNNAPYKVYIYRDSYELDYDTFNCY